MEKYAMKSEISPGIYTISNDDYHRGIGKNALSKGGLVALEKSPAHLKAYRDNPPDPTLAMIFGSQFHYAVLEPELFDKRYVVAPSVDRRTKKGKAEWAEFQLSLAENNQEVITQENLDLIRQMRDTVFKSEVASGLLSAGVAEQSIFWNHPTWGFPCKCRPDFINEKYDVVVDLKSANEANPKAFARAAVNLKYHWQGYWYLAGIKQILHDRYKDFIFIVVEKAPPYAVQIYILQREHISLAREQIKPLLSRYAECFASDNWPGPPDRIQTLELPTWYVRTALD